MWGDVPTAPQEEQINVDDPSFWDRVLGPDTSTTTTAHTPDQPMAPRAAHMRARQDTQRQVQMGQLGDASESDFDLDDDEDHRPTQDSSPHGVSGSGSDRAGAADGGVDGATGGRRKRRNKDKSEVPYRPTRGPRRVNDELTPHEIKVLETAMRIVPLGMYTFLRQTLALVSSHPCILTPVCLIRYPCLCSARCT